MFGLKCLRDPNRDLLRKFHIQDIHKSFEAR